MKLHGSQVTKFGTIHSPEYIFSPILKKIIPPKEREKKA
jgi:hypothetical protein